MILRAGFKGSRINQETKEQLVSFLIFKNETKEHKVKCLTIYLLMILVAVQQVVHSDGNTLDI